jgi:hypothetical protein
MAFFFVIWALMGLAIMAAGGAHTSLAAAT